MDRLKFVPSSRGFLGLDEKEAMPPEEARAVIIPFGLEASVSYGQGTRNGPAAIIAASRQLEVFDEEFWLEPVRQFGLATLEAPNISGDQEKALTQIEALVGDCLTRGKFPLVLGGEHSVTAGAIRPFAKLYDSLTVVHFDAHADLRDGYEGNAYSHAAAIRRVLDHRACSVISIGVRSISAVEIPFLEENPGRISILWAKDRAQWDVKDVLGPYAGNPIYVTFDVDVFDSSVMPATGTPEPGGLFFSEVLTILRQVSEAGLLVGADIVELAPISGLHACDFLAAKLAYKLLSYALLARI
ncbi:MAG: agmatinase [Methyloligellaceae bacterium]